MGVIIPREGPFATYLAERIEDLVVVLLLPLYFTFSGLRTSLGALDTWVCESWGGQEDIKIVFSSLFLFCFILFYFNLCRRPLGEHVLW